MAFPIDSVARFNTSPVFCATSFTDVARSKSEDWRGSSFAILVTTMSSPSRVFSSIITSPELFDPSNILSLPPYRNSRNDLTQGKMHEFRENMPEGPGEDGVRGGGIKGEWQWIRAIHLL